MLEREEWAEMIALAFTLQPEERYLELAAPLLSLVDVLEITPETTWRSDAAGEFIPNGFHRRFGEIRAAGTHRFIAHGVGFSLGSAHPDPLRRARWLARIRADHALFDFGWYTDHLGVTELDGRSLVLPLALPHVAEASTAVRNSLSALSAVVPKVGFENSVFYGHVGDPLDEPRFIEHCLADDHSHLLLDLHNVYTTASNAGFDPLAYIERLPLARVIEIHVSGGTESDSNWLPSGRVMRLDSHDNSVPEEVWRLAERVVPMCSNVRALTLERMEGTVEDADVPLLREELRRARALTRGTR